MPQGASAGCEASASAGEGGGRRDSVGVGVGVLYSNTTFMREITPLLQIRQVAHLMEHHMQPARVGVGVL